jgi:hypothetical protein
MAGSPGGVRPYLGERLTPAEAEAIRGLPAAHAAPPGGLAHGLAPRLPYRGEVFRLRTALHQGQGKLFLGLLRFLTTHGHRAPTVLYVGAAPGTNISLAAALFPDHRFYLYDCAPFRLNAEKLRDIRDGPVGPRIRTFARFFTDSEAARWGGQGRPLLFISDIRGSSASDEDPAGEASVAADMGAQRRWYGLLGGAAAASMFKFRLPYAAARVEYLAGELWRQPFAPLSSTETRLVVVGPRAPPAVYDSEAYEEELFYHNTVLREWGHFPTGVRAEGVDDCYDCAAAVRTWRGYLLQAGNEEDEDGLRASIARMLEIQERHLGQPLLSPPHGVRSRAEGRPRPDGEGGALLAGSRRKHERRRRFLRESRRAAGPEGAGAA